MIWAFWDYRNNPTQDIARDFLDWRQIWDYKIKWVVLPCTYFWAFERLKTLVDTLQPKLIVSMWLSSSVGWIRIEITWRNEMNWKYPDANWFMPNWTQIVVWWPELLTTNFDNWWLAKDLERAWLKTELSDNADGFICNSLIYLTALNFWERIKHVFIHIPWTQDYSHMIEWQPWKITISRQDVEKAVEIILSKV